MSKKKDTAKRIRAAAELVEKIRPILAHRKPEVVGAALGELAASLIASYHPEYRQVARDLLFEVIDDLVPVIVDEMIDEGRLPPKWRVTRQ